MNAICERRVRYVKAGYEAIPCIDKRPVLANWPTAIIDINAPASWSTTYPDATNTGIRTKHTPAVDIDIYDAAVAEQIENELRACFPQHSLLVRFGQPPKRLIPFRCKTPFTKIMVRFKAPDNDTMHKIEVLGDGQQFIADGVHPDTGKAYTWKGGDLLSVPHDQLPLLDEATARRFIRRTAAVMTTAGWTEICKGNGKTNNKGSTIYGRTALKDECAALAGMPKDSGRNDALNRAAFNMFQLVTSGDLNEDLVREKLFAAATVCGLVDEDGATQVLATIESGARAGHSRPRAHAQAEPEDAPPILKSARASTFEMSAVQWLWPNRFALGKLGILAGLPDEGKGQVLCDMAARVTRGLDWPCGEGTAPLGNVVLLTAEDDPKDTVVPRLLAAGADWERVEIVQMVHEAGKDRMFSLVNDLDLLRERVLAVSNVKMIQIDPITAYLGVKQMDSFRTTDVRAVLGPVTDLAGELMVSIVGIMHFNKKTDVANVLLRISDSLAFGATARHVYAVVDDAENKRKLLVKGKNNLAPHDTKALAYGFGAREVGKDKQTGKAIWAPHVIWHPQHVDVTANDAMQAAGGQSGYAKREAREFLLERLKAGPVKADDLLEEAEQNGISKRTLMRMKKDLGIRSRKEQGKIGGTWTWELPPQPRTVADP
jgi:AAA domain/Bifunctional DNA primase/polymerase, N-terminal